MLSEYSLAQLIVTVCIVMLVSSLYWLKMSYGRIIPPDPFRPKKKFHPLTFVSFLGLLALFAWLGIYLLLNLFVGKAVYWPDILPQFLTTETLNDFAIGFVALALVFLLFAIILAQLARLMEANRNLHLPKAD